MWGPGKCSLLRNLSSCYLKSFCATGLESYQSIADLFKPTSKMVLSCISISVSLTAALCYLILSYKFISKLLFNTWARYFLLCVPESSKQHKQGLNFGHYTGTGSVSGWIHSWQRCMSREEVSLNYLIRKVFHDYAFFILTMDMQVPRQTSKKLGSLLSILP